MIVYLLGFDLVDRKNNLSSGVLTFLSFFFVFDFLGNANGLHAHERDFNFWHSSTRMVIEQCFGMLKGRWGILTSCHRLPYTPDDVLDMFTACSVLHNLCINWNEIEIRRDHIVHRHGCRWESMVYADAVMDPRYQWPTELAQARAQRTALTQHLESVHSGEFDGEEINDLGIQFDADLDPNQPIAM